MLGRGLLMAALCGIAACSYDPRRLALDPTGDDDGGDGDAAFTSCSEAGLSCGPGEDCVADASGARCVCGSQVEPLGPVCQPGQTCGPLGCNAPPSAAVFGAVPGSPLRLAAGTQARLDGTPSSDPDGDPLTFAWSVLGGQCFSGALPADQGPILRVSTGAPGAQCDMRLVVTDPSGASDTLEFQVALVGVGGWVYSAAGCTSTRAIDASGPGTITQPWCAIADGLWAARNFGLTAVSVIGDTYEEAEPLLIPPGVLLEGGWLASGAPSSASTSIRLDVRHGVHFFPGGGAGMRNISLTSVGDCDECAFVSAQDALVGLNNVSVTTHGIASRKVALLVRSNGGPIGLAASGLVVDAHGGSRTFGVVFDARNAPRAPTSSLVLDPGSRITTNAQAFAFGVLTLGAGYVQIRESNLTAGANDAAPNVALAYVDGLMTSYVPAYAGDACSSGNPLDCCGGSRVCAGSDRVELLQTASWVLGAGQGFGISLLGTASSLIAGDATGNVDIQNPTVTGVNAERRAVGLRLYGSNDVEVRGASLSVELAPLTTVAAGRGCAVVDGETGSGNVEGGSSALRLIDVDAAVNYASSVAPSFLCGISLAGSTQSRLQEVRVRILEATRGENSTTVALGVNTLGTTDLVLDGVDVEMGGGGGRLLAAVMDGELDATWDVRSGSTNLGISRTNLHGPIGPTPIDGLHACLVLAGTTGAVVARNTIGCSLPVANDPNELFPQVALLETRNVRLARNRIVVEGASASGRVLVGVLDGSHERGDTDAASQEFASRELVVSENLIERTPGDLLPTYFMGIYLRRGVIDRPATLVNNVILDFDVAASYGIVADHYPATVAHNTVRLRCVVGGANDCTNSKTVGVYAMHGFQEGPVKAVGNLIDVDAAARAAFLDMVAMDAPWSFSELRYNFITQGVPLYVQRAADVVDPFEAPFTNATARGCPDVATATTCDKNQANIESTSFCGDGYHLTSVSPAVNAVLQNTSIATDIDEDARPFGAAGDAGADEVHATSTGCVRNGVVSVGAP